MPLTTKPIMIAKLKAAGATEVIQHGASWKFADAYLRDDILPRVQAEGAEDGIYIPPFDHELIWAGNETLVHEIARQLPGGGAPDAIVCSVGGGGLFSGLMQGLDNRAGWGTSVRVLAMETVGADSLAQSLVAGALVTLPAITSIATSLGAVRVAQRAFDAARRPSVRSVVLSDAEACMGVWRLADDARLLVEPACGVSAAVCYDGRLKRLLPALLPESRVVIVVCGGSQVTVEMVGEWRETFGKELAAQAAAADDAVPSTHTLPGR